MGSNSGSIAPPVPDLDLELDGYVEAFEAAARSGRADPSDFLPPPGHPKYRAVLCEVIRADLEFAWDRGEERRLDHYRDRFPDLFADPDALGAVAAEEFRLRQAAGETPDPLEYHSRFGIDLYGLADPADAATRVVNVVASAEWPHDRVPQVGDTIPPGFVLDAELGAGAFGRVYLARQADLASRRVAVKVSSRLVGESQILARLQHTNVVPVYSVHRVGRFTTLVMPFLGRTTLADLIDWARRPGGCPASGRAVVGMLTNRAAGSPPPATATLKRLGRYGFVEVVLWIGSELADGLSHAHERGILHRDIKPANVLLTDDGRPMLLDFNLAADAGGPADPGCVGGTIRYMAPEQLAAYAAERAVFSAQSDIYALGLVFFELLAGRLPFDDPPGPAATLLSRMLADRRRPLDRSRLPAGVSPAVVSILSKCLAPDPADRYASAADLREDLLRQLNDQPLMFAPDPSVRERVRKWARRHPRLSSAGTLGLVAAVLLAAVVAGFLVRHRHLERLEAERARDDLRTAVATAYTADGSAAEVRELHDTLVTALAPFHVETRGWAEASLVRRLSDSDRVAVRQDAAIAMAVAAALAARLADQEADPSRRAVFVAEAETWRERFDRATEAGAEGSTRAAAAAGKLPEKAAALRLLARDGEPRYATWMTLGTVEAKLDRHTAAAEAFTAAMGLNPRLPWPYLHRGIAHLELKQFDRARADFGRFLDLRPDDADGHFNRGIARLSLGDARGAVADFDAAERLKLTPNRLYVLRARAWRQLGDAAAAIRDDDRARAATPTDPRGWAVRGELKLAARPADAAGALADFEQALKLDPDFLPALRDKASVLSEHLNRPADAVAVLDRVLELVPASADDRAGRAVLLARLGRVAEARKDAEACAASDNPLTLYQAACALVLAGEPADLARGTALLRAALRKDPTWAKEMPGDPDLKNIHANPLFRSLVAAARLLAGEN